MKTYTMTVFAGSTMLQHKTATMYGVINALRDVSLKIPEYAPLLELGVIDEYIEDLVLLKNSTGDVSISNKTPFIKITVDDDAVEMHDDEEGDDDGNAAVAT